MPLKLYLVQREDDVDYDEYSECVVCAADEQAARDTHPRPQRMVGPSNWADEDDEFGTWVKFDNRHLLKVTYLGEAKPDLAAGVVSSSFSAG